jgi:methyl acetate hydrolase
MRVNHLTSSHKHFLGARTAQRLPGTTEISGLAQKESIHEYDLTQKPFGALRVLKPETVASMMRNQIGDLDVHAMRTAQPAYSRSFDQFPGERHKWGFSFDINTLPGPNGRSAGCISWAGLLNCYFWLDPIRQMTGAIFTQLLPFYDEKVVKLYGTFERGLYDGLA